VFIGGSARRGVQKILFALANGKQTAEHDSELFDKTVQLLRKDGVYIFAIGVGGGVDSKELRQMTERNEDVILAESFIELQNKADTIKQEACEGMLVF